MPARRSAPLLLSVAVALIGLFADVGADAQKAKPKPAPKKPAATAPATAAPKETAPKEAPPKGAAKAASTPKGGATAPKGADADPKETSKESKDGKGEGVKAYRFEELEIEGRLKSPQIVYFLRRVRAEFAAGDLGHRSFFPELSDSRNDPNL